MSYGLPAPVLIDYMFVAYLISSAFISLINDLISTIHYF